MFPRILILLLAAGTVLGQGYTLRDPESVGVMTRNLGFATYDAAVLSQSPLVYYPQREASGTTATDWSGNSYNGTYTSVTLSNTAWVTVQGTP
jgi:hypothetical protein